MKGDGASVRVATRVSAPGDRQGVCGERSPWAADRTDAPTSIQTDLPAIFASLELSRSTWLITSLSPGAGEKMSKHSIRAGDVAGLLVRLAQLKEKARGRTGRDFPIIAIQEAGLDGFWIHRVLQSEGIESHVVDAASILTSRRRRRAKTDGIDGPHAFSLQTRGAAGVRDGQGADTRRGRPPPDLPGAQDARWRASGTRQPDQGAALRPRRVKWSGSSAHQKTPVAVSVSKV